MSRIELFGVPIDSLSFQEAVEKAMQLITERGPHNIITANPEMIQAVSRDRELAQCLVSADLVVPDGVGVVWALRRMGTPVPERVTGIDLMQSIVERCAAASHGIYLMGSRPGIAVEAASALKEKYPGLKVTGVMHGYFGADEEAAVVRGIQQAAPHVLFVGMGIPRQEKWIERHKTQLGIPLMIGVGGAFDVVAGQVKRAPMFVQRLGFEWLYRLLSQPSRFRRQLVLASFAARVLRESRTKGNHGGI